MHGSPFFSHRALILRSPNGALDLHIAPLALPPYPAASLPVHVVIGLCSPFQSIFSSKTFCTMNVYHGVIGARKGMKVFLAGETTKGELCGRSGCGPLGGQGRSEEDMRIRAVLLTISYAGLVGTRDRPWRGSASKA